MSDQRPLSWVVGAGGLLGKGICRELGRRGLPVLTAQVPWSDSTAAIEALTQTAATLVGTQRSWRLIWCAGAGVVATSEAALQQENVVLQASLEALGHQLRSTAGRGQPGGIFIASSAGAVYAGSSGAPFDETSAVRPISPYGQAKLVAEQLAGQFSADANVPTLIGRIANLYGPGQDITKAQGLISQLCLAHLCHKPISIYVPMDTTRDYLYVDDCARMVIDGLERAIDQSGSQLKILASQQPTSLAVILGELRRVTKRRPQVVLGSSPSARFQTRDLRFRSVRWPELDRHVHTTLPAGIAATLESLGQGMRAGCFAAR